MAHRVRPVQTRRRGAFIEALEQTADLLMTLLDLEEGTREDLWPSTEHIGLPVLLPGGEVGHPLRFERSGEDDSTWALEFRRSPSVPGLEDGSDGPIHKRTRPASPLED